MTTLKKPVKRTTTVNSVPHGINPRLVITLYPSGAIGLREHGRRKEYLVDAGTLYARLVSAEARKGRPR